MEHLSQEQIYSMIEDQSMAMEAWHNHLNNCGKCNELYKSELQLYKQLKSLEYKRPSMRFAKNIYEILLQKEKINKHEKFWIKIIQRGIIGAFAMVFLFTFYLLSKTEFAVNFNIGLMSEIVNWCIGILLFIVSFWILYFVDLWFEKRHLNT